MRREGEKSEVEEWRVLHSRIGQKRAWWAGKDKDKGRDAIIWDGKRRDGTGRKKIVNRAREGMGRQERKNKDQHLRENYQP